MPKLKVCGVKDPENLSWLDYTVDYVGFVYAPGSPRNIDPVEADSHASTLSRAKPVLVIVEKDLNKVISVVRALRHITIIQLHNSLPPDEVALLARILEEEGSRLSPVVLWDGSWMGVNPCNLYKTLGSYGARVEYILVDKRKGARGRIPRRFAEGALRCVPLLGLAGGLDPSYICGALKGVNPMIIDVSSWVEEAPGVKNPDRVLRFKSSMEACLS